LFSQGRVSQHPAVVKAKDELEGGGERTRSHLRKGRILARIALRKRLKPVQREG